MEKSDERKELNYIYDQLDENGRRILLLFARKIPMPKQDQPCKN